MFTFTLNANFCSLSLSNTYTESDLTIVGAEDCVEKSDNVGKIVCTHVIFINTEVVK